MTPEFRKGTNMTRILSAKERLTFLWLDIKLLVLKIRTAWYEVKNTRLERRIRELEVIQAIQKMGTKD